MIHTLVLTVIDVEAQELDSNPPPPDLFIKPAAVYQPILNTY